MDRALHYRASAEQAERRAQRAATDEERRAYLLIAAGWRDLQRQAERP
jgi:hypothetical protein